MPPRQPTVAGGQQSRVSGAFVAAAQTVLELQRNAEEHDRMAAASGNEEWRSYRQAAEAEMRSSDRTALGRPILLVLLGFGASGHRSLATELVRQIISSRQLISQEFGAYFPVLGIADGAGSFSPHQRMPYAFAVQGGLTDAGMIRVAVERAEQGISLRGNGYSSTKAVVEHAGQRGCVLLDLAEDKKAQLKSLPGLLLGGEQGYYAVVVGKRSEAASDAIARAYPAERLLRLSAADLEAAAAAVQAAGSSVTDPLQRKALGLLRRLAAWYLERPEVQQEAAQAQAAQQRFGSRPERRKEAERVAAELAAQPGEPLCPCGCGQAEVAEHMAGILTVAISNPPAALARLERGDHQMAFAIGNILGMAVGADPAKQVPQALEQHGGERLLDAIVAQMAAARQRGDYHMWRGTMLLASNASRFQGEPGSRYRRHMLERGLAEELLIAHGSKDVHTRDAARQAAAGLDAFGAWQRRCYHCRQAEPAGPEGPGHLRVCAGCKSRLFCGKACLDAAWQTHKLECKQLAAL